MNIYSVDQLVEFYTDVLSKKGLSRLRAEKMARVQVEIQAFGITTHGIRPLNGLILHFLKERSIEAVHEVVKDTGSILVADCSKTLNIENVMFGVEQAESRASEHGLAFVSLKNTGWVGALGYHLAGAARRGFLIVMWCQSARYNSVAPFGGREPRLSTNPMAISFPTDGEPFVADFSTSASSRGRQMQMKEGKEQSADPIFVDKEGRSSTDPQCVDEGGAILPAGGPVYGYKGTALSLWIEAMTAAAGFQTANADGKGGQNVHVFALKIDALGGLEPYHRMMEELIPFVMSSAPTAESSGPQLSGARGWKALELARRKGIPLDGKLVEALETLSQEYGVSAPKPMCFGGSATR